MNKIFLLIGILLISCKDKEIEALREENERLRIENYQQTKTAYVWTVIECKVGDYIVNDNYGRRGIVDGAQNTLFWSEIEEVRNFNEDVKYRLQDELEKKCRQRFHVTLHSIIKKETFVFESYVEASQFKDQVLNGSK